VCLIIQKRNQNGIMRRPRTKALIQLKGPGDPYATSASLQVH